MSNPDLPPEILDHTVDLLHDEPETLKQCCLVSKSWIPRTRKYLFARVEFRHVEDLESWKEIFLDPANSPAHHTESLFVGCPQFVTIADAEEGGWIRTFSRVVRLEVHTAIRNPDDRDLFLIPLHNFSPVLKSLRVDCRAIPRSRIFDLVYSLPLLEDLSLEEHGAQEGHHDGIDPQPSTSPPLTGTLELDVATWMEPTAGRLLNLPGGLHFRKLVLKWRDEENLRWIRALVAQCSDTLECIDIRCTMIKNAWPDSIDFSQATKLKDVMVRSRLHARWIVMALQTITSRHRDFRQITIYGHYHFTLTAYPAGVGKILGEEISGEWMDLDRLLVQLWESHGIRTRMVYAAKRKEKKEKSGYVGGLLPEMTARGIIELVDL